MGPSVVMELFFACICVVSVSFFTLLCCGGARALRHQVKQLVQAAKEDEIGTYVVGAFERVMTASEEAIKTIQASSAK